MPRTKMTTPTRVVPANRRSVNAARTPVFFNACESPMNSRPSKTKKARREAGCCFTKASGKRLGPRRPVANRYQPIITTATFDEQKPRSQQISNRAYQLSPTTPMLCYTPMGLSSGALRP